MGDFWSEDVINQRPQETIGGQLNALCRLATPAFLDHTGPPIHAGQAPWPMIPR